jgi:chemotaxis protein CheX
MNTTTTDPTVKVHDLLKGNVGEVFRTMLSLEVELAEPVSLQEFGETLVAAYVGFTGEANGVVYLHATASFARKMAGCMLGMAEEELDDEMVNDAVGELSNMIVGSVKSCLCDSGTPCVLTIPSIMRGNNFKVEVSPSQHHRLLGFSCGKDRVLVELLMKHA